MNNSRRLSLLIIALCCLTFAIYKAKKETSPLYEPPDYISGYVRTNFSNNAATKRSLLPSLSKFLVTHKPQMKQHGFIWVLSAQNVNGKKLFMKMKPVKAAKKRKENI